MIATSYRADRVVLHNISWEQFERLLEDLGDRPVSVQKPNGNRGI
jgi:hypothetical protein